MTSKIEFSWTEINVLNKLLGQVNMESHLTADDLQFISLSPYYISAFRKIHEAFLDHSKHLLETGKHVFPQDIKSLIMSGKYDFKLHESQNLSALLTRLYKLDEMNKSHIKKLSETELEDYCMILFQPFEANQNQKDKIMDALNYIRNTK